MRRQLYCPSGSEGKESVCRAKDPGFNTCIRKMPWRREWQPTLVFFPGKSHGQRSLVGYHNGGVIYISEFIDISPNNLESTDCASSSPAFFMMCSACKLNKQGEKYSLDILLSQFGTSLFFHVQFDLSYPLSLDGKLYFLFSLLPFLLSKVCLTFD